VRTLRATQVCVWHRLLRFGGLAVGSDLGFCFVPPFAPGHAPKAIFPPFPLKTNVFTLSTRPAATLPAQPHKTLRSEFLFSVSLDLGGAFVAPKSISVKSPAPLLNCPWNVVVTGTIRFYKKFQAKGPYGHSLFSSCILAGLHCMFFHHTGPLFLFFWLVPRGFFIFSLMYGVFDLLLVFE